jgi:uncharacterized protein DUF3800
MNTLTSVSKKPGALQFVLCGVLMDEGYHNKDVTETLGVFKQRLFGRRDIILHTLDFTRNQVGFESMAQPDFRRMFYEDLEELIAGLDFEIVACVIQKQEHLQKYGLSALDPYILSLSILVERFIFETGSAGGSIIAESRGDTLNNALELAFLDLKIRGTPFVSATKIRRRIHNFAIREKGENLAGLQLADVVATPIGRHVLGKKTYSAYSKKGDFWQTVETKFRKDWKGKLEGTGLVILPK